MNADKKHASRGLGGARRATARPVVEFPQGAALPRPAVIVPPDPEVAATPTRRRFTAGRGEAVPWGGTRPRASPSPAGLLRVPDWRTSCQHSREVLLSARYAN